MRHCVSLEHRLVRPVAHEGGNLRFRHKVLYVEDARVGRPAMLADADTRAGREGGGVDAEWIEVGRGG